MNTQDWNKDSESTSGEEIERLLDRKSALDETLRGLERELKKYNNMLSTEEKHHRADDFIGRAEVIRSNNVAMRETIDSLRNSDRVLVALREQQGAVDKHMRLRRAQIRQKEATIDVITRRCQEQSEGSRELLLGICEELVAVDGLCASMERMGTLACRVNPNLSIRGVMQHDEVRYLALEGHLHHAQRAAIYSAESDKVLEQLRVELAAAAAVRSEQEAKTGPSVLIDNEEVAAVVRAHRVAWEREKVILLAEKTAVQRMLRDTSFHIRRGTNVKSLSQHPCPPTQDFLVKEVRELQLTLGELEANLETDHVTLVDLERSAATLSAVREEETLKWESELQHQWAQRQDLERSIRQLREYEELLWMKHNGGGDDVTEGCVVPPPPASMEHATGHLQAPHPSPSSKSPARVRLHDTASPGTSNVGTPAVSASEWSGGDGAGRSADLDEFTRRLHDKATEAAQAKRPRRMLERLTAPTRSFASFTKDKSVENSERAQRLSTVASHRPIGCKQPVPAQQSSPHRKVHA